MYRVRVSPYPGASFPASTSPERHILSRIYLDDHDDKWGRQRTYGRPVRSNPEQRPKNTIIAAILHKESFATASSTNWVTRLASVQVMGMSHYHWKDGKIVDEWNVYDELSLLVQVKLGQLAEAA